MLAKTETVNEFKAPLEIVTEMSVPQNKKDVTPGLRDKDRTPSTGDAT